jgi:adenylate cyclase, class 2
MSAPGPIETEIKLAVPDPESAASLLAGRGFTVSKSRIFESNVVFDTTSRDLRSTGCVLRLRSAGAENILTFKGRADRTRHKSREEIETLVSDPAAAAAILAFLGYQPAFRYEKYRTEFTRAGDRGVVTLDETPVGCFMELEGEPDWIDRVASELGASEADYITASYGSLYARHCTLSGIQPTDMVFKDIARVK